MFQSIWTICWYCLICSVFIENIFVTYCSPPTSPDESPVETTKNNFLSPTNTFKIPKVRLLTKTPSVKQLYQSLLQALRNISGSKDDFLPELTKPFFEKVLRDFEQKQTLQVIKVKVRDRQEFGRHFCSEVHAVDVTVKETFKTILY